MKEQAYIINMPYMIAAPDLAGRMVDLLDPEPNSWVILNWRETILTTRGFVHALERAVYDRGCKVAHGHQPPIKE